MVNVKGTVKAVSKKQTGGFGYKVEDTWVNTDGKHGIKEYAKGDVVDFDCIQGGNDGKLYIIEKDNTANAGVVMAKSTEQKVFGLPAKKTSQEALKAAVDAFGAVFGKKPESDGEWRCVISLFIAEKGG